MFDPKSLLDALVRGNAQQSPGASSGGGLEDLLRNFLPNAGADASRSGSPQTTNLQPEQGSSGNPLGDLLSKLQQGGQGGGGLGDILGKLQQQAGGAGGIADILGQVFGQAKSGVREGAGRIDQATGASDRARDAMGQLTGRSPDELVAQIKELIANNQMGAGAALGGLGALILGTGAGRSLAGSAIKLGGLALIGGLAYKALQNYQQGLPPLTGGKAAAPAQALLAAPGGSGFEAEAVDRRARHHPDPRDDRRRGRGWAHRCCRAEEDPGQLRQVGPRPRRAAVPGARAGEAGHRRGAGRAPARHPRRRPRSTPPRASAWTSTATRSMSSWQRWPKRSASTTTSPRTSTLPRATRAEVGAPRVYGVAPVSKSRNAALNASAASYMTQWPAPSIRRTSSSG